MLVKFSKRIKNLICAIILGIYLPLTLLFFMFPTKYGKEIEYYCTMFGVEEELVKAIIKTESGFNKNKVSNKGAVGLMQIIPSTAEFISNEFFGGETFDLTLPETNVKYGVKYLSYLKTKFKDEKAVVASYNAGEGVVKSWLDDDGELQKTDYKETENYLKKVFTYRKIYLIFEGL